MVISVKVKPNSKRDRVIHLSENRYEVCVCASPQKGKANERVIELLAQHFKVPKRRIKIRKGHTSRNKLIEIDETP